MHVAVSFITEKIGQVRWPRFDITPWSMMAEKVVPTRDSFGRLQNGTEVSRWEKCSNPGDQVRESGGGGL